MDPATEFTHESMLLGTSLFFGDPRPFELILVALVGCILVWAAMEVTHAVGRAAIKRRYGIDRMQRCLKNGTQVETGLLNRIYTNKDAVKILAGQTDALRRRSDSLWQAVKDAQDLDSRHLRIVGDEIKGNRCFMALVYNRHVEHWLQLGRSHAYIHESWAKPQLIQVWAHSEKDAHKLVSGRYPDTFGYVIMRLIVVSPTPAEVPHGG